jgi:hypothetical protein
MCSTNQHIYPEFILAISLLWLEGGNLADSHYYVNGVTYPSFYAISQMFLDAVNSWTALSN